MDVRSARPAAPLALALILAAAGPLACARTTAPPAPAPRAAVRAASLPAYDALFEAPARAARRTDRLAAGDAVDAAAPFHEDERLGLPTFVWASPGLAAPRRAGLRAAPATPEEERARAGEAARTHLATFAPLYGLSAASAQDAELAGVHRGADGGVVARFRQRVQGLPVFRNELKILMTRDLRPVALAGHLAPEAEGAAAPAFPLGERDAVARALEDLTGAVLDPAALGEAPAGADGYRRHAVRGPAAPGLRFDRPPRTQQVLFPLPGRLEPATYVELAVSAPGAREGAYHAWVFSAADGRLLLRRDLVAHAAFSYRVWADPAPGYLPMDGPQGNGMTPSPTGALGATEPPFVAPNLVALQSLPGTGAANDPWLADGATETRGNNADAYADLDTVDGFSGNDFRATVTAPGVFDRTYDTTQSPQVTRAQQMAAITSLFYTLNVLHDWFYDAGFDEAAGNAQASNYGRGGVEGDPIHGEAQDAGGTNNANMATPADGASPRMQMYLWRTSIVEAQVLAPPSVAGGITSARGAGFGPGNFDVSGTLVAAVGPVGSNTACAPLTNGAAVAGHLALVTRGDCTFKTKVLNAQLAGATGVLVTNNVDVPIGGMADDLTITATILIPSEIVDLADGDRLRAALATGAVTVRLVGTQPLPRDGSLDAHIVIHEWAHYLSNRLVGNASGLINAQGSAMGEGWSDFAALLVAVRAEDAAVPANAGWNGTYGLSGYAGILDNPDAYYWGIRRLPYTTDLAKNPLTFKYVQDGLALPSGVTYGFGASGANNAEVHNAGEIWANMLWECYAALLRDTLPPGGGGSPRLTFAEAQRRMKQYLVTSLQLTPVAPTFLEARDALLAAARAGDATGQDYARFLAAFAKRGAGARAVGPDRASTSFAGVVESFVAGNDVALAGAAVDDRLAAVCAPNGRLDAGEDGFLTVTLRNTGAGPLSATTATVTSSTPGVSFPAGNALTFPPSAPTDALPVTASVAVRLSPAFTGLTLALGVTVADPGLGAPISLPVALRVNYDDRANATATESFESDAATWTLSAGPLSEPGGAWARKAYAVNDHRYLAPDFALLNDERLTSPPLVVGTAPFGFSFRHRYDLGTIVSGDVPVNVDGGVLELSADGGLSWTDIGVRATPGYGGSVGNFSGAPLIGRRAFVGTMAGYPSAALADVDLGTTYAGKVVQVRFRISTLGVGGWGWEVDDVAFRGLANAPFHRVAERTASCDREPVADAGAVQDRNGGDTVTLDGSASSDPAGLPLTWQWTQVSGPTVALTGATTARPTFTAPSLGTPSLLAFSLVVGNGRLSSGAATAVVRVAAVAQPPGSGGGGGGGCASTGAALAWPAVALLGLALVPRRRRPVGR